MTAKELNSFLDMKLELDNIPNTRKSLRKLFASNSRHRTAIEKSLEFQAETLKERIARIASWIDAIQDESIKRLVVCKYVAGMTWEQTAKECGYYSAESASGAVRRYLKKEARRESSGEPGAASVV